MPPKRKQANDDPASTSTRSTRSTAAKSNSAAAKGTKAETASSSNTNTRKTITGRASTKRGAAAASTPSTNEDNEDDSDAMEVVPPAKKARASAAGSSSAKKTAAKSTKKSAGQRETRAEIDEEVSSAGESPAIKQYAPHKQSNPTPIFHVAPAPVPSKSTNKTIQYEPFTPKRALDLFSTYADHDDPMNIAEHFEQLCIDTSSPMEGPRPFILCWVMGAKNMGQISRAEWVAATTTLQISYISQLALAINDLEQLLFHGKAPNKARANLKKDQDYDRTTYMSYESNPKAAFRKLYLFTFALAKPDRGTLTWIRCVLERAIGAQVPHHVGVLSFISEKGTYRATNKDLWTMMLEFCENVKPTLEDYETDGVSMATLLDDFVLWKKNRTSNGNGAVEIMDTDH
ncbi:hypothetical protein BJ912DRAFT_1059489 [Pholiota molesta]|nr:hypothetical protein BJ912DRAFT_1059489 [Pholiota molesta]